MLRGLPNSVEPVIDFLFVIARLIFADFSSYRFLIQETNLLGLLMLCHASHKLSLLRGRHHGERRLFIDDLACCFQTLLSSLSSLDLRK